jgi:hypothetical protein
MGWEITIIYSGIRKDNKEANLTLPNHHPASFPPPRKQNKDLQEEESEKTIKKRI